MPIGRDGMTDQDRMEDMLNQEKHLVTAYATFIPQVECPQLRSVLTSNFNESAASQTTVMEKIQQLGWRPTDSAPQAETQAARQKFQQLQQQL